MRSGDNRGKPGWPGAEPAGFRWTLVAMRGMGWPRPVVMTQGTCEPATSPHMRRFLLRSQLYRAAPVPV
ncbi:hypothetical protein STPYR_11231 [uncultured Stenotrophomonas sp.]|uniref:Uncharacterized protein n=1 Tax=uncultured Stenotrophomonas sp. TaxID=165438 RepID=A0A1Y5Q221_9GAMM|nr:hypothetical protein STPYR_11231 [uncultured Stenotrophomonas sp.]